MNYSEALNYISNKEGLGIMPGLDRILALLEKMDNPQDKIKIIHIAGTNGKGTVASTISSALINNGFKVGLFTSPWIFDYREQIQINGEYIPEQKLTEYVEKYADNDCSEFEFITAIMYKYFADENVDYAVVECGMGGAQDATNVEKNNVCSVLTSISLDHTNFFGDTIEKITKEKEGIIRTSPCFRYENTGNIDFDNLTLAKSVIRFIGLDDNVELVKPFGRQMIYKNIIFDGGHNLSAGEELSKIINDEVAVIAMLDDKDVDGYLSYVAPKCKRIICTSSKNARSKTANNLMQIAKQYCKDVVVVENLQDAINQNPTLICGSFYLIRDILKII